jgi:hypothetical protein
VQESHGFPRGLRNSAKNIDVTAAKRATLASFLHFSTR